MQATFQKIERQAEWLEWATDDIRAALSRPICADAAMDAQLAAEKLEAAAKEVAKLARALAKQADTEARARWTAENTKAAA